MAIVVNFAGASLRKPGAYSRVRVAQGGAAQAQLGVVAIIGESSDGDPFSAESGLSAVSWSPDQFNAIADKYGSGQLVDASRLSFAPSNDPQVTGGAQQLVTLKTNQSVKAQLALASSYGTVKAKKAGTNGNNLSVEVDNSAGQRIITIADALSGQTEISSALGGAGTITIQIAGASVTASTLTINPTQIITTVTGGTTAALTLKKSQFNSLQQLADYLNSQPGYTVTVASGQNSQPLSVMDTVSAQDAFTAPYTVLRNAADVAAFFAASALVDFTQTATAGVPAVLVKTFLAGGLLGATTNANIQACVDALSSLRINFLIPLFSRDATADITDGLTDAGSSYTIDSIHVAVRTHVAQNSTIKGRKERQGYVGYDGPYATAVTKGANLGAARVSLQFQRVDITDSLGDLYTAKPHMLALINAGMKAAAVVGLPNTFKLININGFSTASNDFDPETQADDAISNNLTFLEKAPGGGFRFVLDNSTYGLDLNAWIYNRPSVQYAADTAAFAIRLNTETFVGQRNSDVSPETIKNLLLSVMDGLRSSGIIVPDASSGGKGFKDLTVSFTGSVINTSVTLILVEGFEFVLNDIQVARAVS